MTNRCFRWASEADRRPVRAMRHYSFAIHKNGTSIEELVGAPLENDDEALSLGRRIILDLMQTDAEKYAGCTLNITEDERVVGNIFFKLYG